MRLVGELSCPLFDDCRAASLKNASVYLIALNHHTRRNVCGQLKIKLEMYQNQRDSLAINLGIVDQETYNNSKVYRKQSLWRVKLKIKAEGICVTSEFRCLCLLLANSILPVKIDAYGESKI